jgi:hypothetical protein
MERNNFNLYNLESSAEKPDDKKNEKKKKSATGLARLIAREEAQQGSGGVAEKRSEKDNRNFLQKLAGETNKDNLTRSEVKDDAVEPPLEKLNAEEMAAIAETYVEERTRQLANESQENERSPEITAEAEADQVFLEALQEHLSEQGDEANVDEAAEAAYQDVAAELGGGAELADDSEVLIDKTSEFTKQQPDEPQDLDPDQAVPLGGSGVGQPPVPPRSTNGVAGSGAPFFGAGRSSRYAPNVAPAQYDDADVRRFERNAMGRGVLVGGVIGYLIGRRRGRIKTEKRLNTVQEKLEQQVVAVQQKIEQKELAIRRLAREKTAAMADATVTIERSGGIARRFVETKDARERATDSIHKQSPEVQPETTKAAIDTLSREELLAYSAQIRVGETSLRRVYEAQMVDEKGLRRLIKEYQAGHDLRRALAREFLVKELKFERDPSLRDLLPLETQPRRQTSRKTDGVGYGDGAATAEVSDIARQIATAGRSEKSVDPAITMTSRSSARSGQQKNVSAGLLIGMTLLTIGLAVYAVWLTLTR